METVIVILLAGVCLAIHSRSRNMRAQYEEKITALRRQIEAMDRAEAERAETASKHRQYREEHDRTNPQNQIKFISQCELHAIRPVNREAAPILYAIEDWIRTNAPKWRVSFEVAMGAFIKTGYDPDDRVQDEAFSSYNSKRVDFLLIDEKGNPKLVVEYNGSGHDLAEDSSDRMFVKRLALQKARIPLIEIPQQMARPEIHRMMTATFQPEIAAPHTSSPLTVDS